MISHTQTDISFVLHDTIDRRAGESRKPESYLQSHKTESCLQIRWTLVGSSLRAKWELFKP